MAVFKCKMCGGTIEFEPGSTVGVCDHCGTKQTLPRLDDDRKANLYDRADHFRRNNDFDKAAGIYETLLNEDKTDAEAYWLLVLCRYGVEYVEDPASHKRIPTVNRAQYTSIFDDADYRSALEYADAQQRTIYESEAAAINEIQKGILAISQKEEPFDVFICYKETDAQGRRTPDSVLATDLYHQLVNEGFKVFFSRITLEDKLGTAYEPYIFAALNSAKVMVVLGTKPEYYNAVWVKNEWSRYLALVKASNGKKILIPAYRDMDPYDLPEEFSHLQAQDMSKLGFMQDLLRGIQKLTAKNDPQPIIKETVVRETAATGGVNVNALLKRAFMFLEDGNWVSADEYCEKVLDQDPENGTAYLGKLMAELHVKTPAALADCSHPLDENNNYQKAVRFGSEKLTAALKSYNTLIIQRNETKRLAGIYNDAVCVINTAKSKADYIKAAELFNMISGFKDADEQLSVCQRKIEAIEAKEEADRIERERKAEQKRIAARKAAEKRKRIITIITSILVACIAFFMILKTVVIPNLQYQRAVEKYGFTIKTAAVGDTIKLGHYEQDNNNSNGEEEIKWKVLEKKDNRVLVISTYALDCQQYYSSFSSVTWEKSSLRAWLNGHFFEKAFNSGEQKMINSTTVTADNNPTYGTLSGNSTIDNVFLLSINEVNRYFSSNNSRKCQGTYYCYAQGAFKSEDGLCWWWLRSPGANLSYASVVRWDGSVRNFGNSVRSDLGAVRPAMWIDLSTLN